MTCKDTGMCKSAAICFIGGCQDKQAATTASTSVEEDHEVAYANSAYRHFMDFSTFKAFRADCASRAPAPSREAAEGAVQGVERKPCTSSDVDGQNSDGLSINEGVAQAKAGDDFAVRFIEQRAKQYLDDHAETEPETGALVFEYGEAGREYHSMLVELADDIRAAMAAPATSGGGNG